MIRFTVKANTQPLKDMQQFLGNARAETVDIGRAVLREVREELLDELSDEPPRRKYPQDYPAGKLEWTSERQRKAFWASDGFGSGIPTVRDHAMSKGWRVTGGATSKGFEMVVENVVEESKFVYGTLAARVSTAKRPQQRFHAITGWPLATTPVRYWMGIYQDMFAEQFRRRLAKIATLHISGRAYTTPRRR